MHLARMLLFVAVSTLVVFIHQIFLVSNQVSDWHTLAHYALLILTAALMIGTGFTWNSYYKLHRHHKTVLDAFLRSRQISSATGKSLRKSESLLESLFGAVSDRILVIDSQNRIIKANRIADEWLGYDPSQREFTEVFPVCNSPGERRNELNLIKYTRTTQTAHRGRLLRGGVDCSMLLSVDTYPVSLPETESDLVVEIARDVTEQTGYELASRHREKMAALGMLVAGFAHDLGNPLASLTSELELLCDEEPEQIHESLDRINEHVARIKRKLHDIVQFARSRDENKRDVDIHVAVDKAIKLTRYDPRAQRIQFDTEMNDQRLLVRMKEDDLVLVLTNLIINAFDAMPDGGTLTINVNTTRTNDALLTVTDTGIGMDTSTLQQAARPLFTTKNAGDAQGSGLGLTMVKQMVESAGGELTLQSNTGRGTRAMLRVPRVKIDHPSTRRNV